MKNVKIFLVLVTLLAVAYFIPYRTSSSTSAKASSLYREKIATPTPLPAPVTDISVEAIQKYAKGEIQHQNRLGLDVSVANFRYENNEIKADVCFQLPSSSDWRVWDATLKGGSTNFLLSTIAPLELTETLPNGKQRITTYPPGQNITWQEIPHNGKPNYLCQTLSFFSDAPEANLAGVDLTKLSLSIQSVGALPREGEECSFYLETVQSRLDAKGSGIKLDCVTENNGSRVFIVQKPDALSQSDAESQVQIASQQIMFIQGPWVFQSSAP